MRRQFFPLLCQFCQKRADILLQFASLVVEAEHHGGTACFFHIVEAFNGAILVDVLQQLLDHGINFLVAFAQVFSGVDAELAASSLFVFQASALQVGFQSLGSRSNARNQL